MSIPQIRTEAIEAVGRKILMEYDPSLLSGQPCPVPIETIIETKFDLILEFHTLRKNPKILGETIFDDGAVVLAAIWYMGSLLISCPSTSTLPVNSPA